MNCYNFVVMTVVVLLLWTPMLNSRLLQVQTVTRHCDRLPVTSQHLPDYPLLDPVKILNRTGSLGTLTAVGLAQCYVVGTQLRARYLEPSAPFRIFAFSSLENSPSYDDRFFSFRSTAVRRSLRSVESISQGLFPPSVWTPVVDVPVVYSPTGFDVQVGDVSLPSSGQPVPIVSVAKPNDRVLMGYRGDNCETIHQMSQSSEVMKKIVEENADLIRAVGEAANIPNFDDSDMYPLYDLLEVLHSHDLVPPELESLYEMAANYSLLSFYGVFGREAQGNLGAGELVRDIADGMDQMVKTVSRRRQAGERGNSFSRRQITEEDPHHPLVRAYLERRQLLESEETVDPPVYMHYGCHDATLGALFAALRLSQDHDEFRARIEYGAAVMFELHEDDSSGELFVRIVYRDGWDGEFVPYGLSSLGVEQGLVGCENALDCPFETFRAAVYADAIPGDWCSECGITTADVCMNQSNVRLHSKVEGFQIVTIFLVIIVVALCVIVIVLVAVVILLCRWQKGIDKQARSTETHDDDGSVIRSVGPGRFGDDLELVDVQ